eukprot:CAMPEP_0115576554 /NCGR_PEP_ID=MMETSP0272-20121206/2618_1 /TAXON_ID=71861 /ORGANISM="Scrippsiella trochoidea, Strain CCMP3099" /LENGTH=59 /DNA_ID=CAMNT_0003011341 /DNA_START=138 /DNA_END=314 /DNA_ORIENTATION=+
MQVQRSYCPGGAYCLQMLFQGVAVLVHGMQGHTMEPIAGAIVPHIGYVWHRQVIAAVLL